MSSPRKPTAPGAAAVTAATKLHVPARRETVPRDRLIASMLAGTGVRLTLVDAPPGCGKTTLLAEWHADPSEERPFAWLSLDPSDNDPVRFFDCVIQALGSVEPGIGRQALAALGTADLDDVVLPLLINDLADSSGRAVLVLDDYHTITSAAIHEAVGYLLDHLPENWQIAIATRSDPPLPLGRLRARRQMIEIRAADLRFTDEEAAALLNGILQLGLEPEDVARLRSRTEGWAAGLQLAALSLRGREDAPAFIASFEGDDRQVVDYLGFEVLDGQPDDVREFLLMTSVLDRLCGSLCDTVTDSEGSAQRLEQLERANLFVVPLDDKREWYRYHQLFGELLRHELERSHPGLAPALHTRACTWHREQGSVPEAVRHAIAAGDVAQAAELVTDHWYAFLQRGQLETVVGWLGTIGTETVSADPALCLVRAWIGVNTGRLEEVDEWTAAAERASLARHGEDSVTESGIASLRAIHRYMSGDVGSAVEAGRHSLDLEPGLTPWRPVGCPVLGVSLFWSGRSADALAELGDAVWTAQENGNHLAEVHALGGMAAIHAERGELREAERLAHTAAGLAEQHDLADHWATTLARVVQGDALEQRGEVAEAGDSIGRGVELSRRGVASLETAYALLSDAQVKHLLGETAAARDSLREAHQAVAQCADPGILPDMLTRAERRMRTNARPRAEHEQHYEAELSDRELAVLKLLPSKLSQREIGDTLYVSLNTVKTHVKSIYRKLDAATRDEAVGRARELQLL